LDYLEFLRHVREIPVSTFGSRTGYCDGAISLFIQSFQAGTGIVA